MTIETFQNIICSVTEKGIGVLLYSSTVASNYIITVLDFIENGCVQTIKKNNNNKKHMPLHVIVTLYKIELFLVWNKKMLEVDITSTFEIA